MEALLKEVLEKLDSIEGRIGKLEKDIDFIKLEAIANNLSIKGIEKLTEEVADKIFNIYDYTLELKRTIK